MLLWLLACTTYDCEPLAQADGSPSGLETCRTPDDTFANANRTSAVACSGDPRATIPICKDPGSLSCANDDECSVGEACGGTAYVGQCTCWPVCGSDADCGANEACVCAMEEPNVDERYASHDVCVPAQCRTGADCESGECGATWGPCGEISGFYCRTKSDECRGDDDCDGYQTCFSTGGKWTCGGPGSCD